MSQPEAPPTPEQPVGAAAGQQWEQVVKDNEALDAADATGARSLVQAALDALIFDTEDYLLALKEWRRALR